MLLTWTNKFSRSSDLSSHCIVAEKLASAPQLVSKLHTYKSVDWVTVFVAQTRITTKRLIPAPDLYMPKFSLSSAMAKSRDMDRTTKQTPSQSNPGSNAPYAKNR